MMLGLAFGAGCISTRRRFFAGFESTPSSFASWRFFFWETGVTSGRRDAITSLEGLTLLALATVSIFGFSTALSFRNRLRSRRDGPSFALGAFFSRFGISA